MAADVDPGDAGPDRDLVAGREVRRDVAAAGEQSESQDEQHDDPTALTLGARPVVSPGRGCHGEMLGPIRVGGWLHAPIGSARHSPANRSVSSPSGPTSAGRPLAILKNSVPHARFPTLLDSAKNGPSTVTWVRWARRASSFFST